MRRAARCSDLGPCGRTPQVTNDCAADAYGLVLGQRRSEEVAPLTGASPMVGGALNVHAPQCTSQTGRPERPDWGRVHGRTTCLGEAASTWHSVLPFAPRRHPVSLGQDQRRISMPSARLDWLIGSGWAASAVRVHGVGRPKPPICRSVWLNVARTMSIMVVDPVRRPLGCSIPALLLVLTTASLQRFHSRSLVAIYRPLLRHQDQLCQESHTRSLNRC